MPPVAPLPILHKHMQAHMLINASAFVKTRAAVTEHVRRDMVSVCIVCQQPFLLPEDPDNHKAEVKTIQDTHTHKVSCVRTASANHLTPRKQEKRISGSTDVTEGWRWSTSATINPQQRGTLASLCWEQQHSSIMSYYEVRTLVVVFLCQFSRLFPNH